MLHLLGNRERFDSRTLYQATSPVCGDEEQREGAEKDVPRDEYLLKDRVLIDMVSSPSKTLLALLLFHPPREGAQSKREGRFELSLALPDAGMVRLRDSLFFKLPEQELARLRENTSTSTADDALQERNTTSEADNNDETRERVALLQSYCAPRPCLWWPRDLDSEREKEREKERDRETHTERLWVLLCGSLYLLSVQFFVDAQRTVSVPYREIGAFVSERREDVALRKCLHVSMRLLKTLSSHAERLVPLPRSLPCENAFFLPDKTRYSSLCAAVHGEGLTVMDCEGDVLYDSSLSHTETENATETEREEQRVLLCVDDPRTHTLSLTLLSHNAHSAVLSLRALPSLCGFLTLNTDGSFSTHHFHTTPSDTPYTPHTTLHTARVHIVSPVAYPQRSLPVLYERAVWGEAWSPLLTQRDVQRLLSQSSHASEAHTTLSHNDAVNAVARDEVSRVVDALSLSHTQSHASHNTPTPHNALTQRLVLLLATRHGALRETETESEALYESDVCSFSLVSLSLSLSHNALTQQQPTDLHLTIQDLETINIGQARVAWHSSHTHSHTLSPSHNLASQCSLQRITHHSSDPSDAAILVLVCGVVTCRCERDLRVCMFTVRAFSSPMWDAALSVVSARCVRGRLVVSKTEKCGNNTNNSVLSIFDTVCSLRVCVHTGLSPSLSPSSSLSVSVSLSPHSAQRSQINAFFDERRGALFVDDAHTHGGASLVVDKESGSQRSLCAAHNALSQSPPSLSHTASSDRERDALCDGALRSYLCGVHSACETTRSLSLSFVSLPLSLTLSLHAHRALSHNADRAALSLASSRRRRYTVVDTQIYVKLGLDPDPVFGQLSHNPTVSDVIGNSHPSAVFDDILHETDYYCCFIGQDSPSSIPHNLHLFNSYTKRWRAVSLSLSLSASERERDRDASLCVLRDVPSVDYSILHKTRQDIDIRENSANLGLVSPLSSSQTPQSTSEAVRRAARPLRRSARSLSLPLTLSPAQMHASQVLWTHWFGTHSLVIVSRRGALCCMEILTREAAPHTTRAYNTEPQHRDKTSYSAYSSLSGCSYVKSKQHVVVPLPPGFVATHCDCVDVRVCERETERESERERDFSLSADESPRALSLSLSLSLSLASPTHTQSSVPLSSQRAYTTTSHSAAQYGSCVCVLSDGRHFCAYQLTANTHTLSLSPTHTQTQHTPLSDATQQRDVTVRDYFVTELWSVTLSHNSLSQRLTDLKAFVQAAPLHESQQSGFAALHALSSSLPFPLYFASVLLSDRAHNVFSLDPLTQTLHTIATADELYKKHDNTYPQDNIVDFRVLNRDELNLSLSLDALLRESVETHREEEEEERKTALCERAVWTRNDAVLLSVRPTHSHCDVVREMRNAALSRLSALSHNNTHTSTQLALTTSDACDERRLWITQFRAKSPRFSALSVTAALCVPTHTTDHTLTSTQRDFDAHFAFALHHTYIDLGGVQYCTNPRRCRVKSKSLVFDVFLSLSLSLFALSLSHNTHSASLLRLDHKVTLSHNTLRASLRASIAHLLRGVRHSARGARLFTLCVETLCLSLLHAERESAHNNTNTTAEGVRRGTFFPLTLSGTFFHFLVALLRESESESERETDKETESAASLSLSLSLCLSERERESATLCGEVLSRVCRKIEYQECERIFPLPCSLAQSLSHTLPPHNALSHITHTPHNANTRILPHTLPHNSLTQHTPPSLTLLRLFEDALSRNALSQATRTLSLLCERVGGAESALSVAVCLCVSAELLLRLCRSLSLGGAAQCAAFVCRLETRHSALTQHTHAHTEDDVLTHIQQRLHTLRHTHTRTRRHTHKKRESHREKESSSESVLYAGIDWLLGVVGLTQPPLTTHTTTTPHTSHTYTRTHLLSHNAHTQPGSHSESHHCESALSYLLWDALRKECSAEELCCMLTTESPTERDSETQQSESETLSVALPLSLPLSERPSLTGVVLSVALREWLGLTTLSHNVVFPRPRFATAAYSTLWLLTQTHTRDALTQQARRVLRSLCVTLAESLSPTVCVCHTTCLCVSRTQCEDSLTERESAERLRHVLLLFRATALLRVSPHTQTQTQSPTHSTATHTQQSTTLSHTESCVASQRERERIHTLSRRLLSLSVSEQNIERLTQSETQSLSRSSHNGSSHTPLTAATQHTHSTLPPHTHTTQALSDVLYFDFPDDDDVPSLSSPIRATTQPSSQPTQRALTVGRLLCALTVASLAARDAWLAWRLLCVCGVCVPTERLRHADRETDTEDRAQRIYELFDMFLTEFCEEVAPQ